MKTKSAFFSKSAYIEYTKVERSSYPNRTLNCFKHFFSGRSIYPAVLTKKNI